MINETVLKQEIAAVCARYEIESYMLLFLEGSKVKTVSNIELKEIAPLIAASMLTRKK